MQPIKLIVPVALIVALALFASRVNAQTMGEYASAVAGVANGGSMGGNIGPASISPADLGGGSRTWGASSLGGSFADRVGAASSSSAATDFESRAGSMTGGASPQSRWPQSQLGAGGPSDRFSNASGRWPAADRFPAGSGLSSSSDRFPPSAFNDNKMGLDTNFNAINHY